MLIQQSVGNTFEWVTEKVFEKLGLFIPFKNLFY